jgi:hypothetical protein
MPESFPMHCYSRVVGLGGYQQVLTHFAAEFIAHFLAHSDFALLTH